MNSIGAKLSGSLKNTSFIYTNHPAPLRRVAPRQEVTGKDAGPTQPLFSEVNLQRE